ncbi:MAG: hypothetical protein V9G08_07670 [Dermatophilaceae bacterium]
MSGVGHWVSGPGHRSGRVGQDVPTCTQEHRDSYAARLPGERVDVLASGEASIVWSCLSQVRLD